MNQRSHMAGRQPPELRLQTPSTPSTSDYLAAATAAAARSGAANASSTNFSRPSSRTQQLARPGSSGSDGSSGSSNITTLSRQKGTLYNLNSPAEPAAGTPNSLHPPRSSSRAPSSANSSNISLQSAAPRSPTLFRSQTDESIRKTSPRGPPPELQRHRPRQHSQGFFEPSLPTASLADHSSTMSTLSASQIAAQAAMHNQSSHHIRHRSQTVPISSDDGVKSRKGSRDSRDSHDSSPPLPALPTTQTTPGSTHGSGFSGNTYQNGLVGSHAQAATTAALVAFPSPRSPAISAVPFEQTSEYRDTKQKAEKSKKKLFSKPKHIGISRDKDWGRDKGAASPSKLGFAGSSGLSRMVNASTSSLVDTPSANSSMYNLSNASASTVVPADRYEKEKEKDKEKDKDKVHKHHFLSRQKLKLKDDHYNLPLSSASSNSRPLDPSAPQSLYNFTPSSPGPSSTTFGKSVPGLDLLHGGRALREKKREEKEKAMATDPSRDPEQPDWLASAGPNASNAPSGVGSSSTAFLGDATLREALQGFGLNNMTPEDVWDFLKAKLLVIFDGEDVRLAIEDLNKLVLIHIQRCVQKHMPSVIVEDLRDLLQAGFGSLNHPLLGIPDEKVVPHLVHIWILVFGTILPFIQAVFLPLDLEFKGRGSIMKPREAQEFWGAMPNGDSSEASIGEELDVRTISLVAFRDTVILNRYEGLKAAFSRLSLENINAGVTNSITPILSNSSSSGGRPGTAASLDPGYSSFNSQSSTLLTAAGSYSSDSISATRSRATSNTSSNPDQLIFQSFSSPSQRPLVAGRSSSTAEAITDTVGRMLQCFSVLASVQSGDTAQDRIETLNKSLKHNWLGRGRTGRDRRGFVGAKVRSSPNLARQRSNNPSPLEDENKINGAASTSDLSSTTTGTSTVGSSML